MNGTWGYNTTVEIPAVPGYYSSLATCGFVDEDDYELAALGGGNTNTTDTTVRLTANRDGCEMKLEFDVERFGYDMYFPIAAAECSETASNGAGTVTVPKLLFLLAWPKPGATESLALATQLTVCTPVYGVDVGTLHVGVLGTHDTKSVKSYEPETCFSEASEGCKGFVDADGSREEFRAVIKAIADLDDSQDLARVKTSKFGTLILNNYDINRRDATLPLTVEWPSDAQEMRDDLITAAQAVYRTLFLAASSTIATDAAGWPLDFRNATVQVVTDTERLFAVGWVCCFTLAVLLGSLGLAIWACLRSVEMRDWDVNAPSNIIQTLGLIAGSEELLSVGADIKRAGEGTFEDAAVNDWNCGKARFMVEANGTDRILRMYPHDSRDS
ncbi:unnamed protein product [Parascedosporium putredinis]|uniref:Uncharacterized protein n=1 Tax=Parascedosporium putredinis TaxID=1442378 RepID=A0A9P1M7X3_9PEZI|nr:unnamed protein product [Parascedosporium putredinis]CAI7992512.1 unnamed protein product [Parascedosporium putredinis]